MANPDRFANGFTQDRDFQPLGLLGVPNPFYYQTFADDFNAYDSGLYTVTANANGAVAAAAGAGGLVTLTTNSSTPLATDITAMQLVVASFVLSSTKKAAYFTRIKGADLLNPAFVLGLIQETTTPFTVTDGVYFSKASGSTDLVVTCMVGSASKGTATVSAFFTGVSSSTYVDLAIVYDGKTDLLVYAGSGLVGQVLNQDTATLGLVARITPTALPTASLSPVIALKSGTGSSKVITADFIYAAVER
jgi:hypothetical protein